MANEKSWQLKVLIDSLNASEVNKLYEYCRRQFPKVFKKIEPIKADSIKEIEEALKNVTSGKPFVLKKTLDAIEGDILHRALIRFKKQTKAAEFLGLKEQTLRYKMVRLKLPTIRANQEYYMKSPDEY